MTEKEIQHRAVQFLEQHYKRQAKGGRLFADVEMRTRQKFGGKRADGLLAFNHWLWGKVVVSLEAKSMKTLRAVKPHWDGWLMLRNCIRAGFVTALVSGAWMAVYRMNDGFWQFLLPINVFVLGALAYGFFTFRTYRHQRVNVIKQLHQYPGNEGWIAFDQASVDRMSSEQWRHLRKICRFQGVGLLIVKRNKKVSEVESPRFTFKWFGDFLQFYSREKEIRELIG